MFVGRLVFITPRLFKVTSLTGGLGRVVPASEGLEAFAQLQSQWSSEVNQDLMLNARAFSHPMLSHWLLDRSFVPRVVILRWSNHSGSRYVTGNLRNASQPRSRKSPPADDSAYHLSCSS